MDPVPAGLGRRDDLHDELLARGLADHAPARVIAQHRDRWLVAEPGDAVPRLVPARGRLRADGPPVAGDWVALDSAGAIADLLERRGAIVRRAAGEPTAGQTLAANVELALVVEPLPAPNERRIERLLALASAGGVAAVLVLTKADLDADPWRAAQRLARALGLADAIPLSARDGDGLAEVRAQLPAGTTGVLLGLSGAGKSTLANALLGAERQATGAVRVADGRGRHTTVGRELLPLPWGGLLIDTPGIREVGLWDGAADAFAEIDALAPACRFSDCGHDGEPGCAVRDAVEPGRLAAWRKLAREQAWIEDRRTAARERERLGRTYRNAGRAARRAKGDVD